MSVTAEQEFLAYANGWHGADCPGNFHVDAECMCGLAEYVRRIKVAALDAERAKVRAPRITGRIDGRVTLWWNEFAIDADTPCQAFELLMAALAETEPAK